MMDVVLRSFVCFIYCNVVVLGSHCCSYSGRLKEYVSDGVTYHSGPWLQA